MIAKCIRCGECCLNNPCFLSKRILSDNRKCSALEEKDGKYSCGLYTDPIKYLDLGEKADWKKELFSKIVANLMGIGKICEKNSPKDLVKSIFGNIPEEAIEFILWERTAFPMAQTAILREQLIDVLIEGNISQAIEAQEKQNNHLE